MKIFSTILLLLVKNILFAQKSTLISGKIVDENGEVVAHARLFYGKYSSDTTYTDSKGFLN
jgi:hypothetical protein